MDKKRKDSGIRATVDRAALLRGVLMLTALALLLCFGLMKVLPTYPFLTNAVPYGIPDSMENPSAAAFPDSGTPTTRSASTGESIAKKRPAWILESYTLTPSIRLSGLAK